MTVKLIQTLLPVLLMFSACGSDPHRVTPSKTPTAQACLRVACLAFDALETMAALGCAHAVVGRPVGSDRSAFPNAVEVGSFISPDVDAVLKLKPDLVITSSDIQAEAAEALVQNHLTVLALNIYTINDIYRAIRLLGRVLERSEQATAVTTEMQRKIDVIRAQAPAESARLRVHFEEYDDPVIAGGEWISEMITLAGGIDVHADLSVRRSSSKRTVSIERIKKRDPDVIIAAWCGKEFDRQLVLTRDGWREVKAIRTGQVYTLPADWVLQPSLRIVEGIERMRAILQSARGVLQSRSGDAVAGFTTSNYYAQKLPFWFVEWQKAHPVSDAYATWNPRDEKRLEAILGPDQAPGEGDYKGFGTHFPHDPRQSQDPAATFRLTPHAAEHMLDLALETASQLELGSDATPDLLALSISGTDYVGHVFGPDSWEYVDHLIRIDLAVGDFLRKLSQQTELAWLLSSDHGVAPLPEKSAAAGRRASRVFPDKLVETVESALDDALGQGDWVVAYVAPFLYLSETVHAHPQRAHIFELTCRIITEQRGIAAAYAASDLQAAEDKSSDRLKHTAYLSIDPEKAGDIYVIPARYTVNDINMVTGFGTNHGTPWEYDQQVPVLVVAEGIGPKRSTDRVDQRRIAPTLAALLGVSPPTTAVLPPLPGVLLPR